MKSLVYVLFVLGLALTACETLPKPTQSGEQTLGCYIEGKRWQPKGRASQFTNPKAPVYSSVFMYDGKESLVISAYFGKESLLIRLNEPLKTGAYSLSSVRSYYVDNSAAFSIENLDTDSTEANFMTDSLHTGEVILSRIDRSAKIVSGKFAFTGHDARTGKTVRITEGRFDLNF